jgi:DHA2 family multidrug resistance protein-like MFS transporter
VRRVASPWLALAVLVLPTLLISIDVSVMLLALPRISDGVGADSTQMLWIMDIYGFMLAGFMITMGTLGDRIGRRKLLLIGATGFSLASVLAAFSINPLMLILARAVLGVCGATISPTILGLITHLFRDPKQRASAISVWFASFMGGMALGPLVGGLVLERFWWGGVFLLSVPVMLLLLVLGPLVLPESRAEQAGRLDLRSVALCLGAILPAIFGLKELARTGLEPAALAALMFGGVVGVAFVRRQQTLEHPLLDVRLFRNPVFSAAIGGMFGVTLTGANMMFMTQYLQLVVGLPPFSAGLWMLPGVAASIAGFLLSPMLARHIRPAHLIAAGMVIAVGGALLLMQVTPAGTLAPVVVGWALTSLGCAPAASLGTGLVVGSVPPEKASSAAAILGTSGELAFAFGIACLGSLGTAVSRITLDANGDYATAFTAGMQAVAGVTALALLGVGVLALALLRPLPPLGEPMLQKPAQRRVERAPQTAAY